MGRALRPWWPLFIWVALIFGLSSIPDLPGEGIDLPRHTDKVVHGFEYLVLAVLFCRGLGADTHHRRLVIGLVTVFTCIAIAALDEMYQSYVPGRDASPYDLAADAVGVIAGSVVAILRRDRAARRAGDASAADGRGGIRQEGRRT